MRPRRKPSSGHRRRYRRTSTCLLLVEKGNQEICRLLARFCFCEGVNNMARRYSFLRWDHSAGQDPVYSSADNCAFSCNHVLVVVYATIILLYLTTTRTDASSGPGLGIKVGAQTIEDPISLDKTTRARVELELVSSRQYGDHFEVALTLGGSSLGSLNDEYADFADGVAVEDSFKADLALFDVRLAARFYPLGDSTPLQPYLGAGIGYYWFLGFWEDTYSETIEDPYSPGVFHTSTEFTDGTDTMTHGLFPFIMAGMTVSVSSNLELVFEFQYDFDKGNSEFDLGGPIYMVGCRFLM